LTAASSLEGETYFEVGSLTQPQLLCRPRCHVKLMQTASQPHDGGGLVTNQ